MNIWLVTIGEPWPTDGDCPRLHRTGVVANYYAGLGDNVTWFNSTFDHTAKTHRHQRTVDVQLGPNLRMIGLHGAGYRKNISVARINHHRQLARDFVRVAASLPSPDVIVTAMPPLELSDAAVRLGRSRGVPVVLDIRDLWPEIFLEVAPRWAQPVAKRLLTSFYSMLRRSVDGATAIVGISDEAVTWALRHGTRDRNDVDGSLPMAYAPQHLSDRTIHDADRFWDHAGVLNDGSLNVCFVGTFTPRVQLDAVVAAARTLSTGAHRVRFILAGSGDREKDLRLASDGLANVVMPGWIDGARIARLLARSHVGLLPYPNTVDFVSSIPNKVFDYLTASVPIATSLSGVTARLLEAYDCGWRYELGTNNGLAALLMRLADRPALAKSGAFGAARAASDFHPDVVYGDFRDKLARLAGAPDAVSQ